MPFEMGVLIADHEASYVTTSHLKNVDLKSSTKRRYGSVLVNPGILLLFPANDPRYHCRGILILIKFLDMK